MNLSKQTIASLWHYLYSAVIYFIAGKEIPQHRNFELITQESIYDCGLACISMISRSKGQNISIKKLRKENKPSFKIEYIIGLSMLGLVHILEKHGIMGTGIKVEEKEQFLYSIAETNSKIEMPIIAHLYFGHYVVLADIAEDSAIVADPIRGFRMLSISSISKVMSGKFIVFDKMD